jgi:hypothetical protein
MKKTITLLCFALFVLVTKAGDITCSRDTIIRTITTVISTDSITGDKVTTTTRTEEVKPEREEVSRVQYGGSSYSLIFSWKKKKRLSPHWTGIGMGFMNYNSDDIPLGSLKMSTSHNFTVNLINYHKQLSNNWLLVSGIGTEWSRYRFDRDAGLTKRDGIAFFEPAPEGVKYKSTKLLAHYITIPLLLEYQPSRDFHVLAGPVLFFKHYSKSQIEYYEDGRKIVKNLGRDLNMRPVDLRLRLQVGIDDVAVYGYYAPFSMFEKNRGPKLNTYTIGVMVGI